jgi:hypothetical protein
MVGQGGRGKARHLAAVGSWMRELARG